VSLSFDCCYQATKSFDVHISSFACALLLKQENYLWKLCPYETTRSYDIIVAHTTPESVHVEYFKVEVIKIVSIILMGKSSAS